MHTMKRLYPYDTILLSDYILVLHSHIKTHTLIFHLILVLNVLNREVYLEASGFFSFLLLIDIL